MITIEICAGVTATVSARTADLFLQMEEARASRDLEEMADLRDILLGRWPEDWWVI